MPSRQRVDGKMANLRACAMTGPNNERLARKPPTLLIEIPEAASPQLGPVQAWDVANLRLQYERGRGGWICRPHFGVPSDGDGAEGSCWNGWVRNCVLRVRK
jgi:hypothetical protein